MRKPLKICHIITRMIVGGAQENTLLSVIGLMQKGHDVALLTGPSPGPEGELLKRKNITDLDTVVIPSLVRELNPVNDLKAYFAIKKYLENGKFDVVHTHSSKAGVIGRLAAKSANVPFIVHTVHGQAFHRYEKPWKNCIYRISERVAARKCDKIYAVCQAMIDQCVAAKIAPLEKYKVVYSGMELEPFLSSVPDREVRRKFGIPEDVPVVGAVARLFPLKGYEYFLPAAIRIAKEIPKVCFLIVGDGTMMDEMKRKASENRLNFIFAGLVPPDEIYTYCSVMDILLHLSLREGLPRAVVQALASGKPAIGFDLDGTPEVIIHGKTGFIARPENVEETAGYAVKLLKDKNMRIRMGEEGRRFVKEKFDWKMMADILEEEYSKGLNFL